MRLTLRTLALTTTLLLFACGGGAGEQAGDSGMTIWVISQPD